jgi:protein phosphatase
MGGHQGGEVASEMAVKIISDSLKESLKPAAEPLNPDKIIKKAIEKANQEIYNAALSTPELYTMGTTVTLGLRLDNRLYIGHVGDSRAYLVRIARIRQLTEDHSLVVRLFKEGIITAEEAKTHPERNKIYRCLGVSARVDTDTYRRVGGKDWLTLINGDILLFCSDGLSGYVSDEEILDCLLQAGGAESACRELVRLANLHGGEDNISVIVVRVITAPAAPRLPEIMPDINTTRKKPQDLLTH